MGPRDRTVIVPGVVPIPVGRRVEIVVFAREHGLFATGAQPRADEPLVRDLETGVVYGRPWHFQERVPSAWNESVELDPRDDLPVVERWIGRVVACRVLCEGYVEQRQQTTLVIAPEAATSSYR